MLDKVCALVHVSQTASRHFCRVEIAPHTALLTITHCCQLSERAHVSCDAFIKHISRQVGKEVVSTNHLHNPSNKITFHCFPVHDKLQFYHKWLKHQHFNLRIGPRTLISCIVNISVLIHTPLLNGPVHQTLIAATVSIVASQSTNCLLLRATSSLIFLKFWPSSVQVCNKDESF